MSLLHGNADLTSQEWAITALVAQGFTNTQIAAEIHSSEELLGEHLRRIFDKTGCWNRTEVALWYLKIGVERERRAHDRRETETQISGDRRKSGRRHPLEPSPRAHEEHEVNLDE